MKVLVVGSGGREHALVWKISQSKKVEKIYCAPGNAGISEIAECIDIKSEDVEGLLTFAFENGINLTVVGPEVPLALGIVDRFRGAGLRIFGPDVKGALLEGSKAYSKDFMIKHNIPTALYRVYTDSAKAKADIHEFGFPVVIKADGLAAGKGVIIAMNKEEAIDAITFVMEDMTFGEAGTSVVIEEFLEGKEASILAFLDGKIAVPMVSAQDYKRVFENDLGPNTGGMGAVSPAFYYTDDVKKIAEERIIQKTMKALIDEGIDYKGVLYFGLMLTAEGPKLLEFNARFGDPETEAVLMRLETDIIEIFEACIDGNLSNQEIIWSKKPSVCVVVASGGYPGSFNKGMKIDLGKKDNSAAEKAVVFHAGTKFESNELVNSGGRVLVVSSLGESVEKARESVYDRISRINFKDMQFRKDIASKK